MRRHHRTAALATVFAVLVLPTAAEAATKSVFAGPPRPPKGVPDAVDITAFFPKKVKVARGDRIDFHFRGFHTITFLGRADLPGFFIPDGPKVSGVNDAAGNPFWFNGQDRLIVNPQVAFPVGDARVDNRAMENSGLPPEGDQPKPHTLRFPRRGTFKYLCLIHPRMRGQVTVVRKGRRVPSARADEAVAARQVAKAVRNAKQQVNPTPPAAGSVLAGNSDTRAEVLRFFPQNVTVKAGTTVRWRAPGFHDFHTVTFGPEAYLQPIGQSFIAPDTTAPQGGPPTLVANPLVVYPSDQPPAVPSYTGSNHGNGFLSTGIFEGDPNIPSPQETSITFTTPGTFKYICLVHGPNMNGTVTVTQ